MCPKYNSNSPPNSVQVPYLKVSEMRSVVKVLNIFQIVYLNSVCNFVSGCVSKYILDTTQNSVKVPYLKVFKIRSAFRLLKHISNSLFELCL